MGIIFIQLIFQLIYCLRVNDLLEIVAALKTAKQEGCYVQRYQILHHPHFFTAGFLHLSSHGMLLTSVAQSQLYTGHMSQCT